MAICVLTIWLLSNTILKSFRSWNTVGVEVGVVGVYGVYALSVVHHVYCIQFVHLLHKIGVNLWVLSLLLLLGFENLLCFFDELFYRSVASLIEALDGLMLARFKHVPEHVDDGIVLGCCRMRLNRYILGKLSVIPLIIAWKGIIHVMRLP